MIRDLIGTGSAGTAAVNNPIPRSDACLQRHAKNYVEHPPSPTCGSGIMTDGVLKRTASILDAYAAMRAVWTLKTRRNASPIIHGSGFCTPPKTQVGECLSLIVVDHA
jgi:hypothetical protein